MKNTTTLSIFFLGIIFTSAQLTAQIQSADFHWNKTAALNIPGANRSGSRTTATCTPDTVTYTYEKASGLKGLTINTVSSANKVGQWFPAPQNLIISGFTFYAWQNMLTRDSVILTCNLYIANFDSLPTGPPLATTTIKVDSSFANGNLSVLQKDAVFQSPVTVNFPYVITVETSSSISAAVVVNDYDSLDGASEWLGMASISGTWLHGYEINVGAVPFNADLMFFPYTGYSLNATFTASPTCIPNGGIVNFTNTSFNPIIGNKFYNQLAYRGLDSLIYTWNYGDNTPLGFVFDGQHIYAAGVNYEVILTANMLGWSSTCNVPYSEFINENAVGNFNYTTSGVTASFANLSSGANSWLWDFGDGGTSNSMNPAHAFPGYGDYNVCLTASNSCITNTFCKNVSLCDTFSLNNFTWQDAGLTLTFSSSVVGADTLWWNFGDGSSSANSNPSHTFTSYGDYRVCLYSANSCKTDSFCTDITLCPELINDFTATLNGQNVNFNNTGSGADGYYWNFGDSSFSQATSPFHYYPALRNYNVCLIAFNDCDSDTLCKAVNIIQTGITTPTLQPFEIFPNPATQQNVSIKFNAGFIHQNQFEELSVYNALGKKVMDISATEIATDNLILDFSAHPVGIYFMQIRLNEGFFRLKFLTL